MKMKKLFVGTSGWVYSDWVGIFYPENLPSKERLRFFSKEFNTVEINSSFYHLPRSSTYKKWYELTQEKFIFAIKAHKQITHIKRLKNVEQDWKKFFEGILNLKEKLGPILFQLPPSFKLNAENFKNLKKFLRLVSKEKMRYAIEFRHKSWFEKHVFDILQKHNVASVIADSSRYPKSEKVTANFVYIRFHGPKELFASKYSKEELKYYAEKIKKWLRTKDVYCYFNNDFHGFAIENARELKELIILK